jgi:hypothetical protein
MNIRLFNSPAALKRIKTYEVGVIYKTTSLSVFGEWYYDPADTTSAENLTTVIVNAAGQRLKKYPDSTVIPDPTLQAFTGNLVPKYLHDIFTGPAISYSFFKENRSYTGACIRVRRSSDDTELDIGFAGGALDEAALLSFVGAGSGFVRRWYDQSGNGNNAVQDINADQPRIVNAGTIDKVGSFVALNFNGTTQFLQATGIWTGAASRHLWAVYRPTSTSGISPIAGQANTEATGRFFTLQSRDAFGAIGDPYLAGFAADVTDNTSPTTGSSKIASASYDGTTMKLYRNNTQIATGVNALNTDGDFLIGKNNPSSFTIARIFQVVAWAGSDKAADREAITNKINNKYLIY